ncbi:flagellar hook-length control protein FliK [Pseudoalteromonas shioyasakiensis]|uniref:Flagellar hook-length control protein FliK n=1 Tax=Pseudoalteromonas shioyasakiensis TaxID=1190813 RepID=A0ABT6U0F4_9GAMM|nr:MULTISPECIES: flagellar hook-length control protein FliK [Pseudoalteromonas]MDI4669618.1 flagellar hook-length control protein FliK [Pseudoalteromonas shioyasakiensis]MDI4674437.1 flagellar hook-length control protein FliK [Pseudoalteromonas shioyasakiensis]MDI4686430.1 flagellar hook-length control protein FliK [Pseudoalteromonas shioyasakiensis]MDI4704720.1 flagellar hook-length control protein FliK [Pseudoalteromonas shioyasakiensis]
MNKQSQLTLSTQLNLDPKAISSASQQSPNDALKMLAEQSLTARNIVIGKQSMQMDVLINNSWQTLRLSTEQENLKTERFLAANIQLSSDGKQLTITPAPLTITLGKSQQLQALLNLLTQGSANTNMPHPAQIAPSKPLLQLPTLKAEFALNNSLVALLKAEAPLKAILLPATNQQNSFNLNIINRFGDSLHQQSVSQQKVAELVAKLTPEMNLKLAGQQVQLSVANKQSNVLTLPLPTISPKQAKQIQAQWQFHPHALKLIPQQVKNTIELINKAPVQQILLKNSLSETFNQALKSQAVEPKNTLIAPSSSSNSPISSWLKDSFADLKTRISDAVRYFEKLPATTKAAVNQSTHQLIESKNTISQLGFNANKINIVKFAAIQQSTPQHAAPQVSQTISGPVSANTPLPATKQTEPLTESQSTKQVSLPVSYNKAPPLIQLLQRIKVSLEPLVSAQRPATQIAINSKAQTPALNKDTALQKAPVDNKAVSGAVTAMKSDKPASEQLAQAKNNLANSVVKNLSEQITQTKQATLNSAPNPTAQNAKPDLKGAPAPSEQQADRAIKTVAKNLVAATPNEQIKQNNSATRAPTEQTAGLQKVAQQQTQLHAPYLALKEPNLSQPLLPIRPIEATLIAKLLPLPESKPLASTPLPVQLTEKLVALSEQNTSSSVDLNRLVNQAFNRMISSQNMHPTTIERELLSILRPTALPSQTQQASFSQGLEQLAVASLAAPIINQAPTNLSFNNQTGLDALLQVLVPNFKAVNGNKLLEQLQQPAMQAMAAEASQLKNTLAQVQTTPINQQQDNSALAQFFLPMKLPPETGQTEISLGQYKKPSKNKLEAKNVWFVRLNFDYAQLGKLQITAEVMDKAVDCQLLASSQEVTALAHPHLETLRHKLAGHGLNVGELNLQQGTSSHQAFYKSHAIINIKV